ncbi:MAG TPA: hypothetical protein VK178_09060 [Opitutaceae bacterium]|nr:hypothetical protein [Opitutaceae bacterium]
MGPAACVFDPAALGSSGATPARLLVGYPSDHPTLGAWGNEQEPNPQYDMSTFLRGIVFPAGTDSVLFFGTAGTGVPRYGLGTTNPALDGQPVPDHPGVVYAYDPIDLGKGCHAYPYTAFVWAYRAQDLARVAAGIAQPWEIVPYAIWPFSFPCGFNGDDIVGGAAYDPATNRIFLSHYNAAGSSHDKPVIHVYRLEPPTPPSATYATWRAAHFSGSALIDAAISGPDADPDGSGVTNFARYAFGLAARGPVAAPATLGTTTSDSATYLTLTFTRRATATDLSYTVEASTDLATWTPVPDLTFAPGAPVKVAAQDSVALDTAGGSRRFLRVRVVVSQ